MLNKMKEMMKKQGKGKKMSEMDQKAKLKVLQDLSGQASESMGSKLMLKAQDKDEAEELLDEAGEVVEGLPEAELEDEHDLSEDMEEDHVEGDYEDEYQELEDEELMPADKFEDQVKDYSDVSEEELDDQIERLVAIREQMKSSTFNM